MNYLNYLDYVSFGAILMILCSLILGSIGFILGAIGLTNLAKNDGIEEAWLAWVPVGNFYIIGRLVKYLEFNRKRIEQAEYILPASAIAFMVLRNVSLIGPVVSSFVVVLNLFSLFTLFKRYVPNKAMVYTIVCALVPILGSGIILYRIKDALPLVETTT